MTEPLDHFENPLTPEALRIIADWLDTYDKMAVLYLDTTEAQLAYPPTQRQKALKACAGKSVQEDLRRWAEWIELARSHGSCQADDGLWLVTDEWVSENVDG